MMRDRCVASCSALLADVCLVVYCFQFDDTRAARAVPRFADVSTSRLSRCCCCCCSLAEYMCIQRVVFCQLQAKPPASTRCLLRPTAPAQPQYKCASGSHPKRHVPQNVGLTTSLRSGQHLLHRRAGRRVRGIRVEHIHALPLAVVGTCSSVAGSSAEVVHADKTNAGNATNVDVPLHWVGKRLTTTNHRVDLLAVLLIQKGLELCQLHIPVARVLWCVCRVHDGRQLDGKPTTPALLTTLGNAYRISSLMSGRRMIMVSYLRW